MASSGVNVLRYTALFAGLLYGITHQRTLSQAAATNKVERERQHEASLIQQAKAEYLKRTQPRVGNGEQIVITDPDDKRFDLEAYLNMKAAE